MQNRLGDDYHICSLGFGKGKEASIDGRYIDKVVDITILKGNRPVAGIAVKFAMQNYSQNSNNYFENMLGETANIRCAKIPYFQIFIIPEQLPYYDKDGTLKHWEIFSLNNAMKYLTLSTDDVTQLLHTPTKTLLFVVKLPRITRPINSKADYADYYNNYSALTVQQSETDYGHFATSVIYNDYEDFAKKVVYYILSL